MQLLLSSFATLHQPLPRFTSARSPLIHMNVVDRTPPWSFNFTGVEPINGVVCYGQDVTEQRMVAEQLIYGQSVGEFYWLRLPDVAERDRVRSGWSS